MLYPLAKPFIFRMDPEKAHRVTIKAMRALPLPKAIETDDLAVEVAGLRFPNPIGLAAGFDKNADVVAEALGLGFGFVEAGTVTPKPQPGNDKPRLFRLKEDRAVINRFGFNNVGHDKFLQNLAAAHKRITKRGTKGIVGGNVGANKTSTDQRADYVAGITRIGPHVNYLTINISSPNTPGLRGLQNADQLKPLLADCAAARHRVEDGTGRRLPLFVKLAPDMTDDALKEALDLITKAGMDGAILTNTTLQRPGHLISRYKGETGGLSGAPLKSLSLATLKTANMHLKGSLPILSVGGIESGEEIAERLRLGASLVQIYSVLVYQGPYILRPWLTTLRQTMRPAK